MTTDLQKTIQKKADEYFEYMVQIRRHLHKNPEVSFQEFDTTDYILHELKKMKIETRRPMETGCLGIIKGKDSDRVIGLRSDIDALPMEEEGEAKANFLSERAGAAHCCGHDGHTANLLGTAKILTDLKDQIDGTIVLIFQPGEEKLPGGGNLLIQTGALQDLGVQQVYGLHSNPYFAPGQVAVKSGPLMACTVEFEVEILGKGGHAAAPHTTVDPIVLASQIITQFQTIVSRSIDPTEPAVITVGKIEAGSAFNVIPENAHMMGTVRAFSLETVRFMKKRMEDVIKGATEAAGATYKFDFTEGYPAVINDEKCTQNVVQAARKILGEENVINLKKPVMAGEDFAFYQQEFPGTFFFLGTGSEEADSQWSWHHPRYNIDEQGLKTGCALMAGLALES
ncbi:M20 metallopeptidase family protein [Rhodohalobacter sp. 614A]|uniref:M20 metallopeptidase family protein n=1 Tax=Rhodohalobacter sp. 614A TaxID=2908649 RepID=UPI001F2FB43A|nr:M20 family metallopeptidase [Rhodohalobacter sp. 614A]